VISEEIALVPEKQALSKVSVVKQSGDDMCISTPPVKTPYQTFRRSRSRFRRAGGWYGEDATKIREGLGRQPDPQSHAGVETMVL
jgi:hypothetical protein